MSSLVYLGLSIILFIITFGTAMILTPIVFGSFFQIVDDNSITLSAEWLALYNQNKTTVQYLVPLIPSLGIVVIIIKVLMNASSKGRE